MLSDYQIHIDLCLGVGVMSHNKSITDRPDLILRASFTIQFIGGGLSGAAVVMSTEDLSACALLILSEKNKKIKMISDKFCSLQI